MSPPALLFTLLPLRERAVSHDRMRPACDFVDWLRIVTKRPPLSFGARRLAFAFLAVCLHAWLTPTEAGRLWR